MCRQAIYPTSFMSTGVQGEVLKPTKYSSKLISFSRNICKNDQGLLSQNELLLHDRSLNLTIVDENKRFE